ncbi:MAG: hypothetical protein ACOYYS_21685 [Chloroflexota bacterium]
MTLRFDDKGKYYTDYVTKEGIPVVIQMESHHIRGYVYVQEDERLSDELNRPTQFLPVTQAVVLDAAENKLYEAQFLAVNRSHIVWIYPEETPSAEEAHAVETLLFGEDPIVDQEVYQVPQAETAEGEDPFVLEVPFGAGGPERSADIPSRLEEDALSDIDLPEDALPGVGETEEDSNA